jgi:Zn-finger nucleic acid-binding protein
MNCPACDRALTEIEVGDLKVDACLDGCGGVWFDAFELQRVDQPGETAGELLTDVPHDPAVVVDFQRKRACPRCAGVKLKRHYFSARRRVEVDHCPNCGGYWLDRGELEGIRAEKADEAAAKSAPKPGLTPEMIRYLYRLKLEGADGANSTPNP